MIAGLSLAFTTPWLLATLVVLPILWWMLRAIPPAPRRQRFPAVRLLLGLEDRTTISDRTPWWLLLVRCLAVAAMIIGFSGPVLNPEAVREGRGPILYFVDAFWPAASDWQARLNTLEVELGKSEADGRAVQIVLSHQVVEPDPELAPVQSAGRWSALLPSLVPVAWNADYNAALEWVETLDPTDTVWISDGVARPDRQMLFARFEALGRVTILEPPTARLALQPATLKDGKVEVSVLRSHGDRAEERVVQAIGPDPSGVERVLASQPVQFAGGSVREVLQFDMPSELRNRVSRFRIDGVAASGAVTLADDGLHRRRVALLDETSEREGLELLSPLHFLREALAPTAELVEGASLDLLLSAGPEVLLLPDVAALGEPDQKAVAKWVAQGGMLLRFAGPKLAAADIGRGVEDILLPVRLRSGGRVVGGAMSWGEPQTLAPFAPGSPFFGLNIPADVEVHAQVLAEPTPELGERTIATLADGTPLVTRKSLGDGQVVLFHVSANAEWSSLALSGLFVQMLERLAIAAQVGQLEEQAVRGTRWVPFQALDAFGGVQPVQNLPSIGGGALLAGAGPSLAPGRYRHDNQVFAVNVLTSETELHAVAWPAGVAPTWGGDAAQVDLGAYLLALALLLLAADVIATLWLSGRLRPARFAAASVAALLVLVAPDHPASAQTPLPSEDVPAAVVDAASNVTLAHVLSGDAEVDEVAHAGLLGLGDQLYMRTSVEPSPPVGIDVERDDLTVYPMLYWPILGQTKIPSPGALQKLRAYLATGGLILFDTRDAGFGGADDANDRLRMVALPLGLPPLEPVPHDHVLTRAFYLLEEFPGRHRGPAWVEAAPPDAERAEGMPFRNLNDGVSPVIIGGNDWAGAWAIRSDGAPLLPVGRGRAGQRQREMAIRFGINLVMHVLTGNYKSDQVHVPALLERLGE